MSSIRHELINNTLVYLFWMKIDFNLQVRLRNLETNIIFYPLESDQDMALFANTIEGSIYQPEFNISKQNRPSIIWAANYFIQTGLDLF